MSTNDILMMFAAIFIGVQICRFLPEFLPKKLLSSPVLQKLNKTLPLVIMVLLVLTSLKSPQAGDDLNMLSAQLLAIVCVLASYRWLENTFLSVALGIMGLNVFLSFLS